MSKPPSQEIPDFSLVQGGPLFQMFLRTRLSGDALELLPRRMILITCVAWVPLLILSALSGHALGDEVATPFLLDIEAHVRFLVAVPVLIAAEYVVHRRIVPIVRNFMVRGLVLPEETSRFRHIVESTMRLRNSVAVEALLLALVYTLGFWVWASKIALTTSSWYAIPEGDGMRLSPAGYWSVFVAVPIFQFILIRWYFRFFVWFSFLWRVSRLRLQVIPSHPDRTAGLGFLGRSTTAFTPILFAQGAMLSGLIASQIAFAGRTLPSFKVQVLSFLIFFVAIVLSPLTVFAPTLWRAKLQGAAEFGQLAVRYNRRFEQKWVHGDAPPDDELLGSGDIQSLADLGNSHSVVTEIRLFPFGWRDVTRLISVAASPLLPLLLTIFSLEEVADYLLKILF
jgi:hypothetical protein